MKKRQQPVSRHVFLNRLEYNRGRDLLLLREEAYEPTLANAHIGTRSLYQKLEVRLIGDQRR